MTTPSKTFHMLRVGETFTFSQRIGIAILRSSELRTGPEMDRTSLNFLNSRGDVVLHIGVRRDQNAIVFNTLPEGGDWGVEGRVGFEGLFNGNNHTLAVQVHPNEFQILVNGNTVYYFKKAIQGDIAKVAYIVDPGHSPTFSNPLAIETYQNWAALLPGLN